MARRAPLALVVLALTAPTASAAPPAAGSFTALTGAGSCFQNTGGTDCANVPMNVPQAAVVSPNGKNVYISSNNGIRGFTRDPATGLLSTMGPDACIEMPSGPNCNLERADINKAEYLVMSSNGRFIYVVLRDAQLVLVVSRDPTTGNLGLPIGDGNCVSEDTASNPCARTHPALGNPSTLALSPDEHFLYVGTFNDRSVVRLTRDLDTGLLDTAPATPCVAESGAECTLHAPGMSRVADLVVSPAGDRLYGIGRDSNSVFGLAVDPATGALTPLTGTGNCIEDGNGSSSGSECSTSPTAPGLGQPYHMAMAPDGGTVYVAGSASDAVASFDVSGGHLVSIGCVKQTVSSTSCGSSASGLVGPLGMAASPDGRSLYATGSGSNVVRSFDVSAGALTPHPPPSDCVEDGNGTGTGTSCTSTLTVPGLQGPKIVALSPGGTNMYVVADSSQSIRAFSVEAAPICTGGGAVTTPFATPLTVRAHCSDANGDPVTHHVAAAPSHGTLGPIDFTGKVTYTPAAGYSGPDSFGISVSDGTNTSVPATFAVTVGAPGAAGVLEIVTKKARASRRGKVTVRVRCRAGAGRCAGALSLRSKKKLRGARKKPRVAKFGKRPVDLAAGQTGKIVFKLSKKHRALLARKRRIKARVLFVRTGAPAPSLTRALKLVAPKRRS